MRPLPPQENVVTLRREDFDFLKGKENPHMKMIRKKPRHGKSPETKLQRMMRRAKHGMLQTEVKQRFNLLEGGQLVNGGLNTVHTIFWGKEPQD